MGIYSVYRNDKRYFTARGALGFLNNGVIDIAWVSSRNDSLFYFPEPVENAPNNPVNSLDFTKSLYWDVNDAVHDDNILSGEVIIVSGEDVLEDTDDAKWLAERKVRSRHYY